MKLPSPNTEDLSRLAYRSDAESLDEMLDEEGAVRTHWRYFAHALEELGSEELERRRHEAARLLRENGVSYNVYGDPEGLNRPWELDPIPMLISSEEWAVIESGLIQRAELLDLVLADIYGPRDLIRRGLLPLELIYAHGGFLRPCDRLRLPTRHQLVLYSADLARGPDGRMWVISDRTQAPSGAGYALENRTATSRALPSLFRDCQVHRLALFFRALRAALGAIAPHHRDQPRVVVLTPGPRNETYFEHAYLAAYLGYALAQGEDLTVREGDLWLKSLDGLRRVDILLRRVDDHFCDPLELREDSRLGVAGLLEAARRGNVAIANPLGSSVLENPGLMSFLPGISRALLGQDLRLSPVASWWCGQPKEMGYVLAHLDRLVIKPIYHQPRSRAVFGGRLSKKELEIWRARIRARPHKYVGQEQVTFSTTPALVNGRLEPRRAILRSFLVAGEHDYAVMPGGLTRIAPERGAFVVSNQAGGISKDTWVLASEPEREVSLWLQAARDQVAHASSGVLPSRAADNLFWVGRYAERAEGCARLLRTILQRYGETAHSTYEPEVQSLRTLLRALTQVTASYPGFVGEEQEEHLREPQQELLALTLDPDRAGGLTRNLQALVQSAYAVRDLWSSDTWRVIDEIEGDWSLLRSASQASLGRVQNGLDGLITALLAFTGLTSESMTRDPGWLLLDIGRRMERALGLVALLRSSLVLRPEPAVESLLLESVLSAHESLITYRRRYRSYLQLQTVLDLLLLDESNPRALCWQLARLHKHVSALPRQRSPQRLSEEERLTLEATTQLRLSDTARLAAAEGSPAVRQELDQLLARVAQLLARTSDALTQTFFSHAYGPRQLVPIQPDSEP